MPLLVFARQGSRFGTRRPYCTACHYWHSIALHTLHYNTLHYTTYTVLFITFITCHACFIHCMPCLLSRCNHNHSTCVCQMHSSTVERAGMVGVRKNCYVHVYDDNLAANSSGNYLAKGTCILHATYTLCMRMCAPQSLLLLTSVCMLACIMHTSKQ